MSASPKPVCKATPAEAPLDELVLPFSSKTEVICTHSSGEGSHSWPNAFYALDLATKYDQPPANILAAAGGKAFVFLGEDGKPCPNPKGTPQIADTDHCGAGWGNHIKILHQNGYATFYVHLNNVFVKNGEFVAQGQPIGTMGWTGLAGHRHLHWSVQKIPGQNEADWENHITWDGESVPFKFKAIQNGKTSVFEASDLQCPHANIGRIPDVDQPHFSGVDLPLCRANSVKVDQDLNSFDKTIKKMSDDFNHAPSRPKSKEWVKTKIAHMYEVDQYLRNQFLETAFLNKYNEAETKCFQIYAGMNFKIIDSANTGDLKSLLKIYHWFTISKFGAQTDKQAWAIVQHADLDPDFQNSILKILEPLVKTKETNLSDYALLYDRVAVSYGDPSKSRPQRYGTQGSCKGRGNWEPAEIEDPAQLDQRRASMGLPGI